MSKLIYSIILIIFSAGYLIQANAQISSEHLTQDKEILIRSKFKRILKNLHVSQLSGDKGNGGDAVIMLSSSVVDTGLEKWKEVYGEIDLYRLYSLDLAEMGIQYQAELPISKENSEMNKMVCVKNHSCYPIYDLELFNELMNNYSGFFGVRNINDNIYDYPRRELANTHELNKIFHQFCRNNFDFSMKNISRWDYEETNRLLTSEFVKLHRAQNNQTTSLFHDKMYSSDTIFAVALINIIKDMRNIDTEFADNFQETLLELAWIVLNTPVNEIDDEGALAGKYHEKLQIAYRKHGVVKISKFGWRDLFVYDGKTILPMDTENRLALIVHEVFYEMTKKQGDKDSERARFATGFLFNKSSKLRSLKRSIHMIKSLSNQVTF